MKLRRLSSVNVCWAWAIVLFYYTIEGAECRTIPNSSDGNSEVTSVNVGTINFDEGQVAVAATVEANGDEIQFQSDTDRDAELRPRHPAPPTHNPSTFSRISSTQNHTRDSKSDSLPSDLRHLEQDSTEALEAFLEWVSGKGIPTTSGLSSKEINSSDDSVYSIAAGGSIPCENKDHIRTEDGICRAPVQFKK